MRPCSPPFDDAPTATTATHQYCSFHGDTGQKSSAIAKDAVEFPWAFDGTVGGPGGVRAREMYQMNNFALSLQLL